MTNLSVGDVPPGLEKDGSFDTGLGVRAHSVIDDSGQILSVDEKSGVLVVEPEEDGE